MFFKNPCFTQGVFICYNEVMNKYTVIILVLVLLGGYLLLNNKNLKEEGKVDEVKKGTVSLCYYYSNKTSSGLYDRSWVRLDINDENVSGEFNNYPAEKDSKIGKFEGTVGPLDQRMMGRTASVWWNSLAEGMEVKEELIINFGEGSAVAMFGEMVDRGDGVYLYKDKRNLTPGFNLSQVSCEDLDEILAVEKYVRDNIKTIATDKPILGGSWYVVSVFVNYSMNSGTVVYEDGHIQSKAEFKYEFDEKTKTVLVKEFKVN